MDDLKRARHYLTIARPAEIKLEVKKSIFIAEAIPASDGVQAMEALDAARTKYPDARHHVSAWRVGTGSETFLERYSDDGEPSGTAGLPILSVLKGRELENVCVIVTRYFGGTLLGTGGLVSAYGDSAAQAVDEAGLVRQILSRTYELEIPYSLYTPVQRLCDSSNWLVLESIFMENVMLKIAVPCEEIDEFLLRLRDLSHGDLEPVALGLSYIPFNKLKGE